MRLFSYLRKKLIEHDEFGHPVALNFNKKGETHNTLLGGVATFLAKVILLVIVSEKMMELVTYSGNNITELNDQVDFDELGTVDMVD